MDELDFEDMKFPRIILALVILVLKEKKNIVFMSQKILSKNMEIYY